MRLGAYTHQATHNGQGNLVIKKIGCVSAFFVKIRLYFQNCTSERKVCVYYSGFIRKNSTQFITIKFFAQRGGESNAVGGIESINGLIFSRCTLTIISMLIIFCSLCVLCIVYICYATKHFQRILHKNKQSLLNNYVKRTYFEHLSITNSKIFGSQRRE